MPKQKTQIEMFAPTEMGKLRTAKSRGNVISIEQINNTYSSYKDPTFNPRLAVA